MINGILWRLRTGSPWRKKGGRSGDDRRRRIGCVFPERRDQIANRKRKGSRGARPPLLSAVLYKRRNLVERCFGKLKQFRAIASSYDKLILWLRHNDLSDSA